MTSNYDGTCRGCGKPFKKGAKILYESNSVTACEGCRPDIAEKENIGVPTSTPVRVRVRLIRRRNPDGWTVMDCIPEGALPPDAPVGLKDITVVGTIEGEPGDVLDIVGSWEQHPRFGWQLKAVAAELAIASTVEGLVAFMKQLDRVGLKLAEKIVSHLGKDQTLTMLDAGDAVGLSTVPGLSLEGAEEAIQSYRSKKSLRNVWLYLCRFDLGERAIKTIIEQWGSNAEIVLAKDPYSLMDVRGFGFVKADEVARKIGVALDDPRRCRAAVKHVVAKATSDGHVWTEANMLAGWGNAYESCVKTARETGLEPAQLEEGVKDLLESSWLIEELGSVYEQSLHYAECTVAERLQALGSATVLELEVLPEFLEGLDEKQAEAVQRITNHGVVVLTGGPGTGKSLTTRAMLRVLEHNRVRVVCCAPTGKAAIRLSEASEHPASTIHRLLEYQPGKGLFRYGAAEALPAGAVIVDEVSMVDVRLMHDLTVALRTGMRLILVGDADQLPSVGPGAVLRDVIEAGTLPTIRLTEIHRQAKDSVIPYLARAVNSGDLPQTLAGPDVIFLPETDSGLIQGLVRDSIFEIPKLYPQIRPQDIQVLAPKHEGLIGGKTLNMVLQDKINWGEGGVMIGAGGQARPGDRVIHTSNNYELGVMNGEIGQVLYADPRGVDMIESAQVWDSGLDAELVMAGLSSDKKPKAPWIMNEEGKPVLVVDLGDRIVGFSKGQARDLMLGYAITVHKSQGSQFPCVVLPVSDENAFMFSRSLTYTAITRAEKLLVLIGDRRVLEKSVNRIGDSTRRTSLRERLRSAA